MSIKGPLTCHGWFATKRIDGKLFPQGKRTTVIDDRFIAADLRPSRSAVYGSVQARRHSANESTLLFDRYDIFKWPRNANIAGMHLFDRQGMCTHAGHLAVQEANTRQEEGTTKLSRFLSF
ncbi:hypothetical protein M514_05291 [Trichuris suis]|uniref:Uncharacterized protein n=1 Tax=Trichuris suis TaxID=68888 RepID=A0A085NQ34_9BILA|nr:hypothetical protein M513_05291 [Trichuris suis]KFD71580.1 hypothetical protein M514_05291 [Trichuris suis]